MGATNIEVGYGAAAGTGSFAAGLDAARQAAAGIRAHSMPLALVFASVRYDLEEMLRGIQCVIPGAPTLGTTTAGEICDGARSGSLSLCFWHLLISRWRPASARKSPPAGRKRFCKRCVAPTWSPIKDLQAAIDAALKQGP